MKKIIPAFCVALLFSLFFNVIETSAVEPASTIADNNLTPAAVLENIFAKKQMDEALIAKINGQIASVRMMIEGTTAITTNKNDPFLLELEKQLNELTAQKKIAEDRLAEILSMLTELKSLIAQA